MSEWILIVSYGGLITMVVFLTPTPTPFLLLCCTWNFNMPLLSVPLTDGPPRAVWRPDGEPDDCWRGQHWSEQYRHACASQHQWWRGVRSGTECRVWVFNYYMYITSNVFFNNGYRIIHIIIIYSVLINNSVWEIRFLFLYSFERIQRDSA